MKSNFQTIILAVFLAFFVFAVLIFSGVLPIGNSATTNNAPAGKVVVWGTFPAADVSKAFDAMNSSTLTVSYMQIPASEYQSDLIKAFASGTTPDLFFLTPDMILQNSNFIYHIPYATYPQKTFQDTFVDGANVYLGTDGTIAMPIVVDPLVLYYNKNLLANESIAVPPKQWSELFNLNSQLTKKDTNGNVTQSMIALGTYGNTNNAKDIISALLLQSGVPITSRTSSGAMVSALNTSSSSGTIYADSVLSFYTGFADPTKTAYSWNRGLGNSLDAFTGNKLAFYVGHASELFNIESINPNLSFNVQKILQTQGTPDSTYGTFYALAINKKSTNVTSALGVAKLLSDGAGATAISADVSLPPTSRALLAVAPADPYLTTFFDSAIISHAWLDPDAGGTDTIFSQMVENILSSKLQVSDAVSQAGAQIGLLLNKN